MNCKNRRQSNFPSNLIFSFFDEIEEIETAKRTFLNVNCKFKYQQNLYFVHQVRLDLTTLEILARKNDFNYSPC